MYNSKTPPSNLPFQNIMIHPPNSIILLKFGIQGLLLINPYLQRTILSLAWEQNVSVCDDGTDYLDVQVEWFVRITLETTFLASSGIGHRSETRADCGDSDRERRGFPGRRNLGMDGVEISENDPFNERIYSIFNERENMAPVVQSWWRQRGSV